MVVDLRLAGRKRDVSQDLRPLRKGRLGAAAVEPPPREFAEGKSAATPSAGGAPSEMLATGDHGSSQTQDYLAAIGVPITVPITSPETTISTRRFCCRPSALSLEATG